MIQNKLAIDYHRITEEIIEIRNKGENLIYELAKRLKRVKDEELWKIGDHESFYSYLAQPELAFDRRTVLFWIQIYETFIEKYALNPDSVAKVGWTKLAKVIPYVDENNHKYMFELAESNSRSDIDKELVKQKYITKSEPHAEFTDCPYCGKSFEVKSRREQQFAQSDYKDIIDKYIEVKEIQPKGNEYAPIQQAIKSMFMNDRTPEQIIATIEYLGEQEEYEWTINTVKNKIAEILPMLNLKPMKPMSEEDMRLLRGVGLK